MHMPIHSDTHADTLAHIHMQGVLIHTQHTTYRHTHAGILCTIHTCANNLSYTHMKAPLFIHACTHKPYIYTYTLKHTCMHRYTYEHMKTPLHACISAHIKPYKHMYMHTCAYMTCNHSYAHMYICTMHTGMVIYGSSCMHT